MEGSSIKSEQELEDFLRSVSALSNQHARFFGYCIYNKKIVSMIRKYHNHKRQTTQWQREEEPLNHHETPGRQIKQSNQLSLPHQDDCNIRMDIT